MQRARRKHVQSFSFSPTSCNIRPILETHDCLKTSPFFLETLNLRKVIQKKKWDEDSSPKKTLSLTRTAFPAKTFVRIFRLGLIFPFLTVKSIAPSNLSWIFYYFLNLEF